MADPVPPSVQAVAPGSRRERNATDPTKPPRRENETLHVARPFAHPAPTPKKEDAP